MKKTKSGLKRQRHPMPDFIKEALKKHNVMEDYINRPAYQQNDYIGWICRAKRPVTIMRRLNQMLYELQQGGVYMKMDHPASKKE
jgi:hypothetical protein